MKDNVFIMDHPLIQHKLSILRDEKTGSKQFRELVSEIAMLMCYESTRDLPLTEVEIKTPITTAKTKKLAGRKIDAVARIKEFNPKRIKFMCIIAAPEGIEAFTAAHPDVPVYCAGLDDHLNDHCYIVPGLGDAGDRIFGTK